MRSACIESGLKLYAFTAETKTLVERNGRRSSKLPSALSYT